MSRISPLSTAAILLFALTAGAQTPPSQAPASATKDDPPPAEGAQAPSGAQIPAPPQPPAVEQDRTILSRAASSAYERRDPFPSVNVYLPEGQASIRLRKLIRNVLFESQIDYEFVNGDISTFLRYKYYARTFTYRLGVFDQITFEDVLGDSAKEFERVRGGLLLLEFPRNYDHRYFWLLQNDRLTFGGDDVDDRKNNIYTKVGYQFGSALDERLNAIVGESRGRFTPVLTAFRDLGPQRFSFAIAATRSARVATGDYEYTKIEAEALKRSDLSQTSFLVTRLHAGAFVTHDTVAGEEVEPIERVSIPRYEIFALGGREGLHALKRGDAMGTHEIHLTNELFVPIFRNRSIKTGPVRWSTLYGIAYAGAGGAAFGAGEVVRRENRVVDAGLGVETSAFVRDFEVIVSVLYARAVHAPPHLEGGRFSFSVRTIR